MMWRTTVTVVGTLLAVAVGPACSSSDGGTPPAVDPTNPDPAKRGYTDDLLARAIRSGLDKDDLELCPQMKHFADMTDFEVFSIIKYLRSLPPVKQKILRSVCPPLKTKEEQQAQP